MATIQERVCALYKEGHKTRRDIIKEYYKKYGEFPNELTIERCIRRITRPTRAAAIFIRLYVIRSIAVIALILIIGAIIGTYVESKEIDRNMSAMYPTVKPIFK